MTRKDRNGDVPVRVSLLGSLGNQPLTWYTYQRYYVMGLKMLPGVRFHYANLIDRTLVQARERGWQGTGRVWHQVASLDARRRSAASTHVGRYAIAFPHRAEPLHVAVDTHDGRHIRDPRAYDWSEIYFKVNRWASLDYGPKVHPLVTGNGALDHSRVARLVALRDTPKQLDLVCVAKLWPSKPSDPTYWNPVEHLVKIFETLSKLKCRMYLRAIVPPIRGEPFPQRFLDRLASAGVQVTTNNITIQELWNATSSARLAFVRPGKHLCVSWRMIDHLAMGACTLCDRAPYAAWPVPLQAGREFINGGCGIGWDETLPDNADYARIADTVMATLANEQHMEESRRASMAYFDQHVTPERLARYLMETCEQFSS